MEVEAINLTPRNKAGQGHACRLPHDPRNTANQLINYWPHNNPQTLHCFLRVVPQYKMLMPNPRDKYDR